MTSEYIYAYTRDQPKYTERFKIGGEQSNNHEFNEYIAKIAGGLISYGGGVEINIEDLDNIIMDTDGANAVIVFGEDNLPSNQTSEMLDRSASTVSSDLRKLFKGLKKSKLTSLPKKSKSKSKRGGDDSKIDESKHGILHNQNSDDYSIAEEIDGLETESDEENTEVDAEPNDKIVGSSNFDINEFIE